MTPEQPRPEASPIDRRTALAAALTLAGGTAGLVSAADKQPAAAQPDARRGSPRRYDMKKSINLWAFPYPQRMTLRECLQLAKDAGFDGIELNYDLENDLSPKSGTKEFQAIRKMAEQIGIAISGVCSFLFWPYSLTSNDPTAAAARHGAGHEDGPGGPRPGDREPAGRAGGRLHSLAQGHTSRCPTTSATAGPARPSAS